MGSKSPVTEPTEFAGLDSHQLYDHIVNIPEIEPVLPPDCFIYEVPINLRQVNEKAYTPLLISIGPLHHGKNNEFLKMEQQKKMYFHFFWKRLPKQDFEKYEAYLRKHEDEIRSCYSKKYDDVTEKTNFVSMILLDAVFIVELFLRNLEKSEKKDEWNKCKPKDYYMFTKPYSKTIQRDLLLLENQLPIFVLKELYDSVVADGRKGRYGNFLHLAYKYFESFDPMKSPGGDVPENLKNREEPRHFTDLIRYLYLPIEFFDQASLDVQGNAMKLNEAGITSGKPKGPKEPRLSCFQFLPRTCLDWHSQDVILRNATKLDEAGITFEKLTGRRFDIKFKKERLSYFLCFSCSPCFNCFKARFQIPQLKVDHTTECVLRNLIAFEQCHHPKTPYVCNYVSLIDSLIHTTDDVELLIEKKVLVHELGSHKQLATLVNGLCQHVVTDDTCYRQIILDLNRHYHNFWNRSMAALRLVYFRDPWRSSSTMVGILIVVFAIFQFVRVTRIIF